jgi:hypothetical protein
VEALEKLSREELRVLNRLICDRLDFLNKQEAQERMHNFNFGDLVSFEDKGMELFGRIKRFNKRSVSLVDQFGRKWTVWPGSLRRVEEASGIQPVFN